MRRPNKTMTTTVTRRKTSIPCDGRGQGQIRPKKWELAECELELLDEFFKIFASFLIIPEHIKARTSGG